MCQLRTQLSIPPVETQSKFYNPYIWHPLSYSAETVDVIFSNYSSFKGSKGTLVNPACSILNENRSKIQLHYL